MTVVVDAEDLDDDMIGAVIKLYEEEKAIMVIVMRVMRIRMIVLNTIKSPMRQGQEKNKKAVHYSQCTQNEPGPGFATICPRAPLRGRSW